MSDEAKLEEALRVIDGLKKELRDADADAEASMRGRMEYLAEMGFPYGCTWNEAIGQCKVLRANIERLKAENQRLDAFKLEVFAWRERFPAAGFDGTSVVLSG